MNSPLKDRTQEQIVYCGMYDLNKLIRSRFDLFKSMTMPLTAGSTTADINSKQPTDMVNFREKGRVQMIHSTRSTRGLI